jgi:hypothetical protein
MRSIYLMGFDRVRRPAKAALIAMVVSAAAGGSVLFASLASGASAGRAQTTASVVTKNSLIAKSQLQLRDRQLTPKDQLAEGLVESAGAESSAPPLVTSLPSGIWDTPQPPFPPGWFRANNAWSGEADGQWWWVFAGEVGADQAGAGQGGVVLLHEPSTSLVTAAASQEGPYLVSSSAAGGLSVTSVTGDVISLQDQSGNDFTFDLDSLTFVSAGTAGAGSRSAGDIGRAPGLGAQSVLSPRRMTGSITGSPSRVIAGCKAKSIRGKHGPRVSPASGEVAMVVAFVNLGAPCVLDGYPTVRLTTSTGSALDLRQVTKDQYVTQARPKRVQLETDDVAYVEVAKYRCDHGNLRMAIDVWMRLPGFRSGFDLSAENEGFAECKGGPTDPGNSYAVTPVEATVTALLP